MRNRQVWMTDEGPDQRSSCCEKHPRAQHAVTKFDTVDHVHPADHATHRREVALVMRLHGVIERVTWASSIEAGARPAEIRPCQPMTVHFVALQRRADDAALLVDEIGNNAAEIGTD